MEIIIKKINFLIEKNWGDSQRLDELLERVKSGKKIYNSDTNYIEKVYSDNNISKIEEIQTKSETSKAPLKISSKPMEKNSIKSNVTISKDSQSKKKTWRNIPNEPKHYGVSYNIYTRDEVKIHKSTCHNYQGSSQSGAIKWLYVNSLKDAVSTTKTLYPKYGDWKCPRCCMYNGALYFECNNCKRYSEDFSNTEKLHSKRWQVSSILLLILPFLIVLSGVQPRLNGLNILLIIIGLVILAIENYRAPKVCRNCLSKDWKEPFVYR